MKTLLFPAFVAARPRTIDAEQVRSLLSDTRISQAQRMETSRFIEEIRNFRSGATSEEDFRAFRLENGVYGIRFERDFLMVRVKVRFGALSGVQLEKLAFIAEHIGNGIAHLTTRQDVQFHWIPLEKVPEVLAHLGVVGLTSREACGNTVRNVTACPEAGVCAFEPFDVTPYADALSAHFLRNPLGQNLPRKFKIAFSGCSEDCAFTMIHDLGFVAATRREDGNEVRGFEVYVGGGLGSTPKPAQRLEEFLPTAELLISTEAVLRLFDRLGNRKERHRARIKFLIDQLGIDEFRRLYVKEKKLVSQTASGDSRLVVPEEAPSPPASVRRAEAGPRPGYAQWFRTNVKPQKQEGFAMAYLALPAGDLTAEQLRGLSGIVKEFADGEIRTTPTQNLLLRWIPRESLPAVHAALEDLGLARPGAHHVGNVVGCPGADTCNLAVTRSHRLALVLVDEFAKRPEIHPAEDLRHITIKVSGCPNACGHHHIASLGLYGGARRIHGKLAPHYRLLLGGEIGRGHVKFGRPVAEIPAKHVPEAILRILELYRSRRHDGESFPTWLRREESAGRGPVGSVAADGGVPETMAGTGDVKMGIVPLLQETLGDLRELPTPEEAPDLYRDWGEEEEFKLKSGRGECAGP